MHRNPPVQLEEWAESLDIRSLDYKLLAGVLIGILVAIPVVIVAAYLSFLRISAHIRAIVNEYGR